jgi:hypothetical protein
MRKATTLSDGVEYSRVEGEGVLLDTRSGRYWQMNASASRVLDGVLQGRQIDEIAQSWAVRSQVRSDRVEADIRSFIDALAESGLVQP